MLIDTITTSLGCLILLLLPGALIARFFPLLWERLHPEERVLPSFLLSAGYLGAIWGSAQLLFPQLETASFVWGGGVVLLLAVHVGGSLRQNRAGAGLKERDRAGSANQSDQNFWQSMTRCPGPKLTPPGGRTTAFWVLPILAIAGIVMARDGGSLGYVHDSLDFVSFIKRMVQTNDINLFTGAYANTEGMGPDPRRGAFHFGLALVSLVGNVEAIQIWRALPTTLVPLSLWIFFATFRRLLQSPGAAGFALVILVAMHLFAPQHFLHNLAYASRLGWVYSWIGLWTAALFLDVERADRTPPLSWAPRLHSADWRGRPGAAALALAMAGAPMLLGIHVLSALTYILGLAAFLWTWRFTSRETGPVRKWMTLLPITTTLALVPFLAVKLLQSYSKANPIFDHAQGLLYLREPFAILAPDYFIQWFGWPGLLGVLLTLPMIKRCTERRDFAFLVGSTGVAALILLNPFAVWIIEKAGAHSVLFRVLMIAPFFQVLGFYSIWAVRKWIERPSRRELVLPTLFLGALLYGVFLESKDAMAVFAKPARRRAAWAESAPLFEALEFLNEKRPESVVVFSDPITSYQIPAYGHHYAIAPFNQHSSPADAKAAKRMQDADAVESAYVSLRQTLAILKSYDAEYLLQNHSFPRYVKFYGTYISPETWPATEAKFDQHPEIFVPIYERDGVRIFGIRYPDRIQDDRVGNPHLVFRAADIAGADPADIALSIGATPLVFQPIDGLEPIGVLWPTQRFAAGDYLRANVFWRRTSPAGDLPVEGFYRAETLFPDEKFYHPLYGKPFRRFYERKHGETYRFGRMRGPIEGDFPPFLWEEGAVYVDKIEIPIPAHAAPGRYTISLKVWRVPFAPNYNIGDYFNVRDNLDGKPIGEVEIFQPNDESASH